MIRRRLERRSELSARHWTIRQLGRSAGTWSIPRGSGPSVQIRKDAGSRIALWQAHSFGSRSTRIPRVLGRIRGGRHRNATAGARAHGQTREGLPGAGNAVGNVDRTAAIVDGRAERVAETAAGAIAEADVRGHGVVKKAVRREATGNSATHARNGATSKDCLEPQPWARRTMGKRQVPIAGMLPEDRSRAELFRRLREMVMRSPRAKEISLHPGVTSPLR